MSAPLFQTVGLSDGERAVLADLSERMSRYAGPNLEAEQRYEGSWVTGQFGISIPPSMKHLHTVAGWAGTAVDVLEERLDLVGWSSPVDLGLSEVYSANALDVDAGYAHLDALIYGVSFVAVGTGVEGEPHPLVTPLSPRSTVCRWDARRRRVAEALNIAVNGEGDVTEATLYLPDETIFLTRVGSALSVAHRDRHGLGRTAVVAMPNRTRAARFEGRSEITRAVRYYSDAAARTLLGLEVNREFYNSPQRYALNVDEDMFQTASGAPVSQWPAIQGRVWMLPPADPSTPGVDPPEPKVGQFNPTSPAPYIDQVKSYAQLLAAEAGIPGAYLGFQTDNPASADAILAGESRLVKRAERRQATFGRAWLEVARMALLVRDGRIPDEFSDVTVKWRPANTPTQAAAADAATKLVGAGILPPDSSVTYDLVGLDPDEQKRLESDRLRAAGNDILDALRGGAQTDALSPPDEGAIDGVSG